jgi:hypothetical protein
MWARSLVIVLAVAVVATLAACGRGSEPPAGRSPSPPVVTGLVFAFGPGARNVLDTAAGTFTKDMILASPLTVPLRLSDAEMARITRKLEDIDFWSYPPVYKTEVTPGSGWMSPSSTYRFEVTTAAGTSTVTWKDEVANDDPRAQRLRELAVLIQGIVTGTPEYRAMPEAEGGYL